MNWPLPAVRWEPPSARNMADGGGALQRSEKTSSIRMRFGAGPFGASPSSTPCAPFPDVKISKNLSRSLRKVFRLEPTPILCFHRLTINFNRTLVSVKSSKFGSITKLDSSQRIQIQPENARPATNLAAVGARLAAPAPSKPRRVNQSHG